MVEPIQIKRFGWKRDSLDHRDKHYRPMIALRHLPSVVDLDHPPHLDQLALGSCVLNSTTAVLRQALIKQGYGDQLYSRLQLYWDVRHVEGSGDEDAGAEIRDAIKCLADTGVAPEPLWPYNIKEFKKKPFSRVYERALQFKALEYRGLNQLHRPFVRQSPKATLSLVVTMFLNRSTAVIARVLA